MRIRILISFIFIGLFNSFAQNADTTLVLSRLKIQEGNDLIEILRKISLNEQKNYGKSDTLLYDFIIARTNEKYREPMDNHESVYIGGIDDEWHSKSFGGILGYIEVDNIYFIVSYGGFPKDYFSNVFLVEDIKTSFTKHEYKEKEVYEEDDSVIRIWCVLLYKDGQFKTPPSCCHNNNSLLHLFDD